MLHTSSLGYYWVEGSSSFCVYVPRAPWSYYLKMADLNSGALKTVEFVLYWPILTLTESTAAYIISIHPLNVACKYNNRIWMWSSHSKIAIHEFSPFIVTFTKWYQITEFYCISKYQFNIKMLCRAPKGHSAKSHCKS